MGRTPFKIRARREAIGSVAVCELVLRAISTVKQKAKARHKRKSPAAKASQAKSWKKYYDKNASVLNGKTNRYYYENRADLKKKALERIEKLPSEEKERRRRYQIDAIKKRYITDEAFRITLNLRTRVRNGLRRKGKSKDQGTFGVDGIVGCTKAQFVKHLEKQLVGTMTLSNTQVDHVWPLDLYDLGDPKEVRKAMNWQNCQPLWPRDNIVKSNRVPTADDGRYLVPHELWPPGFEALKL